MIRRIAIYPLAVIEIAIAALEAVTASVSGLLAILRVYVHRDYDYRQWLKRDLADCESILELGCGSNSPILQIGYGKKTTAIDIFLPYVEKHCRQGNYRWCYKADILTMPFPEKSVDAVVMCDVLEHLPLYDREELNLLITQLEKCAKKKVILFTPNGFIENDEVDGDPHQAHVSSWVPEDYSTRGYKVVGATGLRWLFGKASLPKYHPYSVVQIIGMLSQPVIYHKPEWAWHSYAVKETNENPPCS